MHNREIARMMDMSCVCAGSTFAEIDDAVSLAVERGVFAVFVLPAHMLC